MHYFPSTYEEIEEATVRIRHESMRSGTDLPRLIIWGRLQERAVQLSDLVLTWDWNSASSLAMLGEGEFMGIPFKVDYDREHCFEPVT